VPSLLAALAAAGALAAGPGQADRLGGQGDVRIEAERMTCDATSGRCLLEGRVLLRRGEVTLRADRAVYQPDTGEVQATGDVLLVDQARVVSARAVRAVLGGPYQAEEVVAWLKDGPVRLEDVEEAGGAAAGRTRLRLSGGALRGEEDGPYVLEGARVTICDCPGGAAPTWELRSRRVEIVPGRHADLEWPVLHVRPPFVDRLVPVLPIPWIRLPVTDRQSGLLLPTFVSAGASGTTLAQPLFLTLGRSADATLTASYAFGATGDGPVARGPGASLEVRWAPAPGAEGEVEIAWLHDTVDETDAEIAGASGGRVALRAEHAQRFSEGIPLRLDVGLFADPLHVRDLGADRLGRDAYTRRSAALLSFRGEQVAADVFAAYHLALAPDPLGREAQEALVDLYGPLGTGLPVFHRWPSASATLLPVPLLGPLRISGRLGLSRFAPLSGDTSDAGLDGLGPGDRLWPPGDPPFGVGCELDGEWNCFERLAVARGDARAELSLPLLLARAATVEPYVRGAALGYLYDAERDPEVRAWGVAGAILSTELSRRFGTLRHVIVPRLEWRLGSAASGPEPAVPAYDAWDRLRTETALQLPLGPGPGDPTVVLPPRRVLRAAPGGTFQQATLALETRLSSPAGDLLRLSVGQDLDVAGGRPAESWFAAWARVRPLELDVRGRLDLLEPREEPPGLPAAIPSWLDAFTSLRASASLADRRGDRIGLGLIALGSGASGDLVAGMDALFDPLAAPVEAIAQGTLAASVVLGPATLGWEAQFPGRPLQVDACPGEGGGERRIGAIHVQQHVFRLAWDSPCRCLRVRAAVTVDDCGRVGFSGGLDLGGSAAAMSR
jgi:LPS-assembly protein